jgi:hypothetical protein
VISADRPRIKSTLKILLPTTLPTAMSVCPEMADCTLTAISGELVPKATMVRPIISGGDTGKGGGKPAGPAHEGLSPNHKHNEAKHKISDSYEVHVSLGCWVSGLHATSAMLRFD